MKCIKPFGYFGCGKCGPCRANRKRLWTGRMMLEMSEHPVSSFVTWTFKEDPGELDYDVVQAAYKRLRYFAGPFRHYTVGEYGGEKGRAHWHAAIFGLGFDDREWFARAWRGHLASEVREVPKESFGGVHVGELNHDSAQYLCKYMSKDDGKNIVRMSRNPGIGVTAIRRIGDEALGQDAVVAKIMSVGDVPHEIRQEKQRYPLGRHLRGVLRQSFGQAEGVPREVYAQYRAEMASESAEGMRERHKAREAAAISLEGKLRIKRSREKL